MNAERVLAEVKDILYSGRHAQVARRALTVIESLTPTITGPDNYQQYHRITDDELLSLCRYLDRPTDDRAADVYYQSVRARLMAAAEDVLNEERSQRRG